MTHSKTAWAIAALIAVSVEAKAEDYPFVAEALPPHIEARAAEQAGNLLLGYIASADEYFIAGLKVWDTAQPIRVCFFGGSQTVRSRIAQVASEWTRHGAHVPLDFGNLQNPRSCALGEFNQIRIGFAYKGYWSTVGTDSVNLVAQYEQSMNLALYDINPPAEPTFSRVVLHEFGHALGFRHEHQSETAPCVNEFDWEAIYAYLQGPPNYWSIEQIDHNLKPKVEPGDASSNPFDRASIMLYSFPPNFYKAGTQAACYTPGNDVISEVDIEGLTRFYPAGVVEKAAVQSEALSDFFASIDALPDISEQAKSLAKIEASTLGQGTGAVVTRAPVLPWQPFGAELFAGGIDKFGRPLDPGGEKLLYLERPPQL